MLSANWEIALYVLLAVVAVATRFWDLGARAMSHDESLHALYSWKLYDGQGYVHNPMMHGPFLFHINALFYFLFGANDYTARISPALFGVALVFTPYFLRRWLGRAGALVAALMLTISPSFLYYSRYIRNDIYVAVWTMLLILALFKYIDERRDKWLYFGAAVLSLSMATKENTYIVGFIGLTFVGLAVWWELASERAWRLMYFLALGVGVVAAGLALLIERGVFGVAAEGGAPVGGALVQYLVLLVGLTVAALVAGLTFQREGGARPVFDALRSVSGRALAISFIVAAVIFTLLFTTFLTNPLGLGTGAVGSISYWLAQHGVQRGGQPWYYYLLLVPLYEFVPLLFSLMAMVYYIYKGVTGRIRDEAASAPFVPFVIYWLISTFLLYSWAGEKMPWLMLHPVLPMIVLSACFIGEVVEATDWGEVWRRGGAFLALLLPLIVLASLTLVREGAVAIPTLFRVGIGQGPSLQKLNKAGQWLAALAIVAVLVWAIAGVVRRLGRRRSWQVAFVTAFAFLSLFTIRFAWMAAYINYDYTNEMLVYAHGTPDVKLTMREIEDLSRRTVGDRQIKVAYDDDSTWPLEWYLRNYPNRAFYGAQPTREALDAPVVIVGSKNEDKAKPFLGNKYYRFDRRLVWWPIEDYKGLTWQRIWDTLRDSEKRHNLWNVIFYRRYNKPFNDWPYVHRFAFYVRKDVANQLWDYRIGPVAPIELPEDKYARGQRQAVRLLTIGAPGSGPGQFLNPRNVAVGADGHIYVLDTGNHRLQVFDANGAFLRQWGSQCKLDDGTGCVDPDDGGPLAWGDGQFQEPWGIAVAPDGTVYVADTWNHRIQKFDAEGNFLAKWGAFADTGGTLGGAFPRFYGPRAIALDADGNLYVTDTGNKRVEKFSPDGELMGQWGGFGALDGQFSEPVGIAIDGQGYIYVADTWNQRIQKFDADFNFVMAWPVYGWESQSVVNKPYLAVDGEGHIYATDPEGYRVLKFDAQGNFLATFGEYGLGDQGLNLPIGIAVDGAGNVYVADSDNNRVVKFAPVR